MAEYIAKKTILMPGTLVAGYQPGDPVSAYTVGLWDLDDEQVEKAEEYQAPRPAGDSTDRVAWEAYVVGQGASEEDARAASLDELKAMYEPPPAPAWEINDSQEAQMTKTASAPKPEDRPADSAKKSDWVAYVVDNGGDADWANASSTTKDELMAWKATG
jgi:hypothetical protein